VGDQGDRGLGWDLGERLDRALGVGLAPALDSVDQQVAPLGDQRNGGERGDHGVHVRRAASVRGLEELERPGSALPLGAFSQPAASPGDLRLVGAGDQVRRLHLRHAFESREQAGRRPP
jgi:hypothetical protein